MGFTGAAVRGVFTRMRSLATVGAKSLIKRAPKLKMDVSSITHGRILQNPRRTAFGHKWNMPSTSSIRHMLTLGAFGSNSNTAAKYMVGAPFFTFAKNSGLHENNLSSDGIGLALFKGRHSNLL
jgi:hypothetical protein